LTFKGGIHPADRKKLTEKLSIVQLPAPEKVYLLMQQHIGAPCEPIVSVGDKVKMGQKIGEGKGFVSAHVHSTVSGEVIAIEPMLHPNGSKVLGVVISNDGLDTKAESLTNRIWQDMDNKEILEIINEAGIVGMGGATFPTHVKLSPPPDKKIDYAIINGAECEPFLTSDHRVMLETPGEVITGLKIIMKILGLEKGYIGIEANKPDAIKIMKEHASKEKGIEVLILKTKYPQGSEKQLILAVTGREVPSGGLPADAGAMVHNIDTCTAIARAFVDGTPLMRRIVTVSGSAIKEPHNFAVRIGTPFRALFDAAGGFVKEPKKIIMGGPMMGIAQYSLDVPVIKGTSGLLAFTAEDVMQKEERSCIRCGKCVDACPINLLPLYLNANAVKNNIDKCEELNAADCIECGSCSYVCPSKRHLVQTIRIAKQEVLARKRARK
jgi:electron transport complex protein RnfC